jgi:hypothetical protein
VSRGGHAHHRLLEKCDVSILTGPEGPVSLGQPLAIFLVVFCFNPHRPRRAGVTVLALRRRGPLGQQFDRVRFISL